MRAIARIKFILILALTKCSLSKTLELKGKRKRKEEKFASFAYGRECRLSNLVKVLRDLNDICDFNDLNDP